MTFPVRLSSGLTVRIALVAGEIPVKLKTGVTIGLVVVTA